MSYIAFPSCCNCISTSTVASQTPPTAAQPKKKPVDESSSVPATGGSNSNNNNNPDRFCSICQASFNNPLMAQQHYVGKKHRKQMTKMKLMETYGPSTAPGQTIESKNLWLLKKISTKLSNNSLVFFLCAFSFHTKGLPMHHLQHRTKLCGAVPVSYQWCQTQEPVSAHTCFLWEKVVMLDNRLWHLQHFVKLIVLLLY